MDFLNLFFVNFMFCIPFSLSFFNFSFFFFVILKHCIDIIVRWWHGNGWWCFLLQGLSRISSRETWLVFYSAPFSGLKNPRCYVVSIETYSDPNSLCTWKACSIFFFLVFDFPCNFAKIIRFWFQIICGIIQVFKKFISFFDFINDFVLARDPWTIFTTRTVLSV